MTKNWKKIKELILNTDKEILKKAIEVDGHTLYKPEKFLEAGLDPEIVQAFTKEYKSDYSDPKSTIFTDDQPVDSLTGVYGLYLLEFIADCFEIGSWKMGRGSRAAHFYEQLMEKWK